MPHYNICDDKSNKMFYFKWYDDDNKVKKMTVNYTKMGRDAAMKQLEDKRYQQIMEWKKVNQGLVSVGTNTDLIEHNEDSNISMTLTNKNFGYDLFSFDPKWDEEDMDKLLENVHNPYDFKKY